MALPTQPKLYKGVSGDFSLRDLENFPYIAYLENKERYRDLEYWYSGEALDTTKRGRGGEAIYPKVYSLIDCFGRCRFA